MDSLEQRVEHLNGLIEKGDSLTAMNLYYDDHVQMQENEGTPRIGKFFCIEHERQNIAKLALLTGHLLRQVIDPIQSVVFSEWELIFTTTTGHTRLLREVSVQEWKMGKIIIEKFYYKAIISPQ